MYTPSTYYGLMAEHGTAIIELSTISKKLFGLSPAEAAKKASLSRLEVPAFKMGSQKGNWLVNIKDLADLADKRLEIATKNHKKMNS